MIGRLRNMLRSLRRKTVPGDNLAYAATLKERGTIKMGDHCAISPHANITDPAYLTLGDNVRLSDCHLFGHDGSINMVNRAEGTTFDAVGPITIGSNVFVGHGAIILPGTVIGDNVIVGAGSVLKGHYRGGFVYAGAPARAVRTYDSHIDKLRTEDTALPEEWRRLLRTRRREFDAALEPRLIELRRRHFYGEDRRKANVPQVEALRRA